MADDHQPNPRGPTPSLFDADLHESSSGKCGNLVDGLGSMVDDIRQIATDLGARPHTYHSVTVKWTGGEKGRGEASVVSDVAILPTPRTESVGWLDREQEAGGVAERGDIVLTGISPRFTEDEIDVLFGVSVEEGLEVFIEQRIDQRDGNTRRRRFMLAKAPERRPTRLDWRVTLRRADGDRARDGEARAQRERKWRRSP